MPSNSKRSANQPANSSKQNSTSNAPAKPTTNATSSSNVSNTRLEKSAPSNVAGGGGQASNRNDMSTAVPEAQPNPVNRKKQKRRQKQAARLAEQQLRDGNIPTNAISPNGDHTHADRIDEMHAEILRKHQSDSRFQYEVAESFNAVVQDGDILGRSGSRVIGQSYDLTKRKGKKKKTKRTSSVPEGSVTSHSTPSITRPIGPSHSLSNAFRSAHAISKDRIWNTSTHEERENIKEFWLQLGEEERRSLVKVEKEAVLRKMKEQQKHSCSCTVCGRKRTAIEEELEVLYDAYYEELEQYANNNQGSLENGGSLRLPPRVYQTPLHTLGRHHHHHHHHHHPHPPNSRHPPSGRIREISDDEEDEVDEEYDEDDEDDEPYSDDDLEDEARTTRTDFFAFGNSLTVKDGILTVADDLLKNDGKHFIDMMEQLAERRMQREEETQYAASSAAHQSMQPGHNHGPPLDEEEYDDEEEEDYDSQEEDEFEEDEMDTMTEEQRMEEGRRMFQIFAARMFEQRVLTAYREKVARERQQRLIEELEEESRLDEEREAKKAKEAQRKKDKKRMQKQAKEEEKARREADRAAEEAAQKALEEKKLEEQRRKKEEQRKKRELEKKAQEEERLRKETEKQKRLKDERERQAELERKQREQKEKEKKKREEAKKKERDEKEAKEKEKEQRKKKSKEERDRKAREEQAKREKDAAAKADRESKEHTKQAEEFSHSAQAAKRPSQPTSTSFLPPGLQHPSASTSLHSPHFQVATPVVPKAPTPVRPRQPSQQGSHASSPRSQFAHTENSHISISPGAAGTSQSSGTSSVSGRGLLQHPILQHPQPNAPMSPLGGVSRGPQSMGFNAVPTLNGLPPNPPGIGGIGHRMPLGHDSAIYSSHPGPVGGPFRNYGSPDGIPLPPGINAPRHMSQGRGYPLDASHGGLPFHPSMGASVPPSSQAGHSSRDAISHTGQTTAPFERKPLEGQPHSQPISRPAPIQRPSSTVPHDQGKDGAKVDQQEIDALSTQLGSSALLDDTDVPLSSGPSQPIPVGPPGLPAPGRMSFGTSPLFSESLNSAKSPNFPLGPPPGSTWGPQIPFGPPGFPGSASWGPNTGATGWSNNAFGIIGGPHRSNTSRPVTIRLLVSQACKQLSSTTPSEGNSGFHNVNQVLRQIEQLSPQLDVPISLDEMLDICDTEGNTQNGGGSFAIKNEGSRGTFVKFEADNNASLSGVKGNAPPGDIGSPVPSASHPVPVGVGSPLIPTHLHK